MNTDRKITKINPEKKEINHFSQSLDYDWKQLKNNDALDLVLMFLEAKKESVLGTDNNRNYYYQSLKRDKNMFEGLINQYPKSPLPEIKRYIYDTKSTITQISQAGKLYKKIEKSKNLLDDNQERAVA